VFALNETFSTVRKDFNRFFSLHSENLFCAALVISTMSNVRIIAANGLLLSAYLVVAEQLKVLTSCLGNILYPQDRLFVKLINKGNNLDQTGGDLQVWQEFQQHLARFFY